jgi:hypothetical protein
MDPSCFKVQSLWGTKPVAVLVPPYTYSPAADRVELMW